MCPSKKDVLAGELHLNLSSSTFTLRRKRWFFFLRKQTEYKVHWKEKEIMDIFVTEYFDWRVENFSDIKSHV